MDEHWNRLSSKVVEFPSYETIKTQLDMDLSNLLWQGVGPGDLQRSLPASARLQFYMLGIMINFMVKNNTVSCSLCTATGTTYIKLSRLERKRNQNQFGVRQVDI